MNSMVLSRKVGTSQDVFSTFYSAIVSDFRDTFPSYGSDNAHDDRRYLLRRLRDEGSMFAIRTMSLLGRSLNEALVTGVLHVPSSHFRVVPGTSLPRLCHNLWRLIFSDNGIIRIGASERQSSVVTTTEDSVSLATISMAIRSLRQLTLAWSKVVLDSDDAKVNESIRAFVDRTQSDPYLKQVENARDWHERQAALCLSTEYSDLMDSYECQRHIMADNRRCNLLRLAANQLKQVFQIGKSTARTFPLTPETSTCSTQVSTGNMGQVRSLKRSSHKEKNGLIFSMLPGSTRITIDSDRCRSFLAEAATKRTD
jgi:hypothetical protein